MLNLRTTAVVAALAALGAGVASAQSAPGYIYSSLLLGSPTQSCIAAGPGGTFVAIGPGFTANAQSVVLAKESGDVRLVAAGFNSIGDCAYDAAADVLYVTDNADNGDFGIVGIPAAFAAQSGDTVFAIPSASTASGLAAPGLELIPVDSLATPSSVTVDASGNVFVTNSLGGSLGTVTKITGTTPAPFASGFDFTAGVAVNPSGGNIFVAESLDTLDAQITQYTPAGATVPPVPFAGPSFTFGSYDLAFNSDGRLLASGLFGGDVLSFDVGDSTSVPFASGLNFATSLTVDPFTRRVQALSTTFVPTNPEDRSLHRFTPIDQLVAGGGSAKTDCLHEAYGVQVVDGSATCTDGAACDADGKVNDACVFPLGFCLNVDDPDLAECDTASNITEATLSAKPVSATIADASARIVAALPLSGSTCVFSDGYFVPLKVTGSGARKDGKASVKVAVTNADGKKDSDTIKLVCQPSP